jgi:hypothetical protein
MRYCLLFIYAAVVFASCGKELKVPPSRQNILMGENDKAPHKWKVDTMTLTYALYNVTLGMRYDTTIPVKNTMDCHRDDTIKFRKNMEGAHLTGSNKCGAQLTEYQFAWGITEQDTKMYLYDAGSFLDTNDINATIKEFSDSKFTIVYDRYKVYPSTNTKDTLHYMVRFIKW